MKKVLLIAVAGLLTTASIIAASVNTGKKTVAVKKECNAKAKAQCPKMERTHCFD